MILFLLGLIIGFMVPAMANPRMALSAHLEGLLNGMFLMVLALIWKKMQLNGRWFSIMYWLAIYGSFANLFAVLLAAATGAGKMMPIAGGKEGEGFIDPLISFLLITLSLCMVAVCAIVITGLYRAMKLERSPER